MSIATISAPALFELCQRDGIVNLIDVRTAAEFSSIRAAVARNVALDRLTPELVRAACANPTGTVYLICKGGTRSAQAAEKLQAAGLSNVCNVEGGTLAWEKSGLPVVRGDRKILPLDRQVQLTAGLMALTGGILGFTVNYWLFLIPTFVGFGLTMAGSTGFCPMGILLARMPWNQNGQAATNSCCTPASSSSSSTGN